MTDYSFYYQDPMYIPCVKTFLAEKEAIGALREGWKSVYGAYPKNESLAILMAQFSLETGRGKSCYCYNYGNVKKSHKVPDDGYHFTMLTRVSEIINGKEIWFNPPDPQTHFVAFKTAFDGAVFYIRFLSQRTRYAKAWQEVLNGNPSGYSHQLKLAGYYTANEASYTSGVVSLFNEFLTKISAYVESLPIEADKPAKPPVTDKPVDIQEPVGDTAAVDNKNTSAVNMKDTNGLLDFILQLVASFLSLFKK